MQGDLKKLVQNEVSGLERTSRVYEEAMEPQKFPSLLQKMTKQGATKICQVFSEFALYANHRKFTNETLKTNRAKAEYRSNLGEFSNSFITANPGNHPMLKFNDEKFLLLLRKRYNDYQPCVMAVRGMKCQCGHKKVNEEHIFKCATEGCRQNRHTDMKLAIFAMQKNAGIVSSTEDCNLVPGDGKRRHADIIGHHCKMSHEYFEKFGADVTIVYHDYQSLSSMRYRGIAASNAAKNKRTNMDTEVNLVFNGMKFYPLAFEVAAATARLGSQLYSPC